MKKLGVVLGVALAILMLPRPAQAAGRPVYVEVHWISTQWKSALDSGKWFVDPYTGTQMVYGRCKYGYKCIHVHERYLQASWGAITEPTSTGARITFNSRYRNLAFVWRRWAAAHELGHANGLWFHSACSTHSTMSYCSGGRLYFTSYERSILQRN